MEEREDDICSKSMEIGVGEVQPSYLPGKPGEVVLDLKAGESGGELCIKSLRSDFSEAVHSDPTEVKALTRRLGRSLYMRGFPLHGSHHLVPEAEANPAGQVVGRAPAPSPTRQQQACLVSRARAQVGMAKRWRKGMYSS
jgi:hypothetical protein